MATYFRDPVHPPNERELLALAEHRARAFVAAGSRPHIEVLDGLHVAVAQLAVDYQKKPLAAVLANLVSTQDTIFTLLQARQPPADMRRLLLLASVTSGLLARVCHDRSTPQSALTHCRTAFMCADQADHNGMRAWIRGLQSLIAYWAGQPHEAIRSAQQGSMHRTTSTASVWLPIGEARAWAVLGDTARALAAIRRAELAREAVQPDEIDDFGGLCTFSANRQLYYTAESLALLPTESLAAEQYSLRAVSAYRDPGAPDWAFGDAAGSACGLAVARIARGEVAGASEALERVLALPPGQRINSIVLCVQRVQHALAVGPASREARLLSERIENFAAAPLATMCS
ncbi:MAG: XRE family transcriptional regulator [Angustibacter sp.]